MAAASGRAISRGAVAAHVYVSEGRDLSLVSRLAAAGAAAGATIANEFVDPVYNRSGLTLASADAGKLEGSVAAVCREALLTLDLRQHTATHPRVGVVDHVAFNPLGSATCEEAAVLARRVGQVLGLGAPGSTPPVPSVPVYLYGAVREDQRPLAALRRSLGYFNGASKGEWSGLSADMKSAITNLAPDFGPGGEVDDRLGAAVVGAVPWVHNYNLLITAPNLDQAELMTRCRRVARATSARGGGLAAVETMALPHDKGVEVACNLLDVSTTSPSEVRTKVASLCEADGLSIDSDYFTNKRPDDILSMLPSTS